MKPVRIWIAKPFLCSFETRGLQLHTTNSTKAVLYKLENTVTISNLAAFGGVVGVKIVHGLDDAIGIVFT